MAKKNCFTCPVCSYPYLSESPRSEYGGGSFEMCPGCGFQFGVNDDDEGITYEEWRKKWIAGGMKWHALTSARPADWKPDDLWGAGAAAPAKKAAKKAAKK